ncbi:MAG: ketose-bisphosphate aldolase [Thioalkalispiraceae bacterium]|jgi:fructose-bisphosphate aldolase class II
MPLVNMRDMLNHAYRNGYAVGGFDLVSLDFLEAIMAAAEAQRSPVILSLAESHFEYYDFELAMAAAEQAAKRASVPVAIHLDHGASYESAVAAINLGCNGVMVDASHQSFDDNVATTRKVVNMAHACGVPVEGELGYVAGVEGEDAEKHPGDVIYTSVDEATTYVEQTGVDLLAVSIGTVHGRMQGEPHLDFERLERINQALQIPLVIHGGTGLSDEQFRKLIANGVAKINYYTALADAAGASMRDNVAANERSGYTGIVHGIQDAIRAEVERCMINWGSAGQADEVLAHSTAWQPVQHVIIYNVDPHSEVDKMMREGEAVLSKIPGVRRVITGTAVQHEAQFRYCWLIEFVHEKVIESYRDHPAHQAFANEQFRPIAADRISIDFQ